MAAFDKLLKFLDSKNIAESLGDEQLDQIAQDVIVGTEIDETSREQWLRTNQEAMKIVKHFESPEGSSNIGLYEGQAKVVYPLLGPAILQLASRLITHIVRNKRTVESIVLGKDEEIPNPDVMQQAMQQFQMQQQQAQMQPQQQGQQPPQPPQPGQVPGGLMWKKASRAKRVTDFMNYKLLVKSRRWLINEHKFNTMVAAWGTAFKRVYYDPVLKENCSDVLHPEDVIINHNIYNLEDAPRVTIKHYLTKNQIIENIRSGYFLDVDLEQLDSDRGDEGEDENDSQETHPTHTFLCQTCYLDLDEDDYCEPYKVYVHKKSKKTFGILPAYEFDDIKIDEELKGKIIRIERRLDIVDRHLADDPDGKYFSLGLNSLLVHQNKAITSTLRQLMDAGTLSNAAAVSGFVTKAFKTKEREIRIKLGSFPVLDCNPTVDPSKQIIPMPFREPSQVLLGLLQLLIETGKNNGFINDILTGDVEMQNVPATTSMAMVEQSTRAFKPIIEKLYISLQQEFKMHFHLYSKHLDQTQYIKFQDQSIEVSKDDFNEEDLDICPVADPTMSSEAQGFAQAKGLIEGIQVFGPVTNMKEAATRFWTQMQFDSPEKLVAEPQPQADPKMVEIQLKQQIAAQKHQIDTQHNELEKHRAETERMKVMLKGQEVQMKVGESASKKAKMQADAHKDLAQAHIAQQQADTASRSVEVESQKVDVMRQQANNKKTDKGTT